MHRPDELDDYLKGNSPLSRLYRREDSPEPPHALDRRVLISARKAQATHDNQATHDSQATHETQATPCKSPYLAPLAFAASLLLSVALVLAMVSGPKKNRLAE